MEEKGIKFHLKSGVKEIVCEDGKVWILYFAQFYTFPLFHFFFHVSLQVTGVTLPSDETIAADIVVAGVGQ